MKYIGVLVVALASVSLWWVLTREDPGTDVAPSRGTSHASVVAKNGDLKVVIVADGKLATKDSVSIKHIVDGQLRITELVAEGKRVEKGEVLVRFDDGKIKEKLRTAEEQFKAAQSTVEIAKSELSILEKENELALNQAAQKVTAAKLELDRYQKGTNPRKIQELEFNVEKAVSSLKQAKEAHAQISDPELVEQGFVTSAQIEQERIKFRSAEIGLQVARGALEDYRTYTIPTDLNLKETAVKSALANNEKIKSVNNNKFRQKKADLKQKEVKARLAGKSIEEIKKKVAGTTLYAPCDGLVLYGSGSGRRVYYSEGNELKVGSNISKNRVIMHIPKLEQMKVSAKVEEADIANIKKGMKVVISSDAYPDQTWKGTVTKIGNVPTSVWYETVKKFAITIMLPKGDLGLRPGISVKCEIQVEHLKEVLLLPIATVFTHEARHFIYLHANQTPKEISLGLMNETHVEVQKGLEAGQQVMLYEPDDVSLPPPDPAFAKKPVKPLVASTPEKKVSAAKQKSRLKKLVIVKKKSSLGAKGLKASQKDLKF